MFADAILDRIVHTAIRFELKRWKNEKKLLFLWYMEDDDKKWMDVGDRPFFSSTKFLKEEIVYENTNYHAAVN